MIGKSFKLLETLNFFVAFLQSFKPFEFNVIVFMQAVTT